MKPLVIVGAGKIAYVVSQYIKDWRLREIAAYAVDQEYLSEKEFFGRPVIDMKGIATRYPAAEFDAFVAMGYQKLNQLRRSKVDEMRQLGYRLVSIVHPNAPSDLEYGANCFIAESHAVQPGVSCCENVFVWSGSMIGHHTHIEDDCWVTGGAMLAGGVQLGRRTFVGLGAQIGQNVVIGEDCMIGAGALLTKSVPASSVLIEKSTEVYRLNSQQFLRITDLF